MKRTGFFTIAAALAVICLTAAPLRAQETDPVPNPTPTEEEEIEKTIDEAIDEEWVDTGITEEEPEEEPEEVVVIEEVPEIEVEEDDYPKRRKVQTIMSGGGGGYGALAVGYTQIGVMNNMHVDALQMGASAAWVIGHGFGLGIAGVGFTSDQYHSDPLITDENYYAVSGGYGGLLMEPIILGWLPVHISLPVVIGGGGLTSYSVSGDPWDYDNIDPTFGEYSVFFVAEAGAELEFNLTRFFRLTLFGNYRWTTPLDMKPMYGLADQANTVSSDALRGWSAGVRLKFGSF